MELVGSASSQAGRMLSSIVVTAPRNHTEMDGSASGQDGRTSSSLAATTPRIHVGKRLKSSPSNTVVTLIVRDPTADSKLCGKCFEVAVCPCRYDLRNLAFDAQAAIIKAAGPSLERSIGVLSQPQEKGSVTLVPGGYLAKHVAITIDKACGPGKVTRPADLCCGTGQNPCCETYSGPSSPRHDVGPQRSRLVQMTLNGVIVVGPGAVGRVNFGCLVLMDTANGYGVGKG